MTRHARPAETPPPGAGLSLIEGALGQIMPLFLWLDASLRIVAAGPTMHKVCCGLAIDHGTGAAMPGRRQAVTGQDMTGRADIVAGRTPAATSAVPARATGLIGRRFDDVFDLHRPRALHPDMAEPHRVRLCLRAPPGTAFRGLAVPLLPALLAPATQTATPSPGHPLLVLADGQVRPAAPPPAPGAAGLLLDLSFGIAVAEAVRAHDLTDSDFAATDLAVELLYLQEANAAVLAELGRVNQSLVAAKSNAEEQALTDTLTGLRNRRAMDRALDRATRTGQPFGLMHLDLDYFKQVNDTYGHAAGDHVLAEVARALREETRAGDIVARVGGDEFLLLFPGLTDPTVLSGIATRIIRRLEVPIVWEGRLCRLSASIGFTASTLYPRPEPDRLLSDADSALYTSKRAGRGRATGFDPDAPPAAAPS